MRAMGILFSNIHDSKLKDLTKNRTTASLPYGGRYRLIDFTLSSLVNADITEIGIITKNNYRSLMDHLGTGKDWDLNRRKGGLSIFPPFVWNDVGNLYRGKIEALAGIEKFISHSQCEYAVLSDCNIVCSYDAKAMLDYHMETGADITVAYHEAAGSQPNDLILITDNKERATDITIPITASEKAVKSGLGIYILRKDLLLTLVTEAYSRGFVNFERDCLQKEVHSLKIYGYEIPGYSAVINSINDYYKSNMDLLNHEVREELFYKHGNIFTKVKDTVPAKYEETALVKNSLIADGCIIEGEVENSIIFRGVKIGKGAVIKNSIIMQASDIGEGSMLTYVVADKSVKINKGRTLTGLAEYPVVVAKESVL